MGFPVVDDGRQVQGGRQLALLVQAQELYIPGQVFLPVIIKADFADGDDLFVFPGQPFDVGQVAFVPTAA